MFCSMIDTVKRISLVCMGTGIGKESICWYAPMVASLGSAELREEAIPPMNTSGRYAPMATPNGPAELQTPDAGKGDIRQVQR